MIRWLCVCAPGGGGRSVSEKKCIDVLNSYRCSYEDIDKELTAYKLIVAIVCSRRRRISFISKTVQQSSVQKK